MHRALFVNGSVVSLVVLASVGIHAQLTAPSGENAAMDVRCGMADIRGSYGFFRSGVNAQGAIAAVGVGQFDGDGNMTTTQTTSRNGVVTQGSFPGAYEVMAD